MASAIGSLILRLCDRHDVTQRELASLAGVDASVLSKIVRGMKGYSLKGPAREKIAQKFNLTLDEFDTLWRGEEESEDRFVRGLDNAVRAAKQAGAVQLPRPVRPDEHLVDERPAGKIPVINSAPAGETINYEEWGIDSRDGFRYIDRGGLIGGQLFAVEVVGESMEPVLFARDEVVLRWMDPHAEEGHEPLPDGTVVFIRFSDDAPRQGCTLARWYFRDDRITLRKDNPTFPPETYAREDIAQVGKFVQRRTSRV